MTFVNIQSRDMEQDDDPSVCDKAVRCTCAECSENTQTHTEIKNPTHTQTCAINPLNGKRINRYLQKKKN